MVFVRITKRIDCRLVRLHTMCEARARGVDMHRVEQQYDRETPLTKGESALLLGAFLILAASMASFIAL